ncbi:unnamed protein product [Phytophthora lilii]|uniref:Unnamed protein product n=1 Tax=Phytophthora lilii TaxID=2077276 RepID=A0A9W6X9M4_9STRA|nr:unnamed protein product [Phytophthora lilii]
MEEPTAPEDTSEDTSEDFYKGVNDVAKQAINNRAYVKGKKTLREVVHNHVWTYLNKQREFRREDSNRRRQEMAAKFADEVMKESAKLLERKRIDTPPNKSPTDKRATKSANHDEDISRQLFQQSDDDEESDDEETKEEIKKEKELRKLNPGIKKYILTISTATKVNLQQTCTKKFDIGLETLWRSAKARTILMTMLLNRQGSIK